MTATSNRQARKRRRIDDQASTRSRKANLPTEWRLVDDQLDEALRQTFPASDALSMVQGGGRNSRFA